MKTLAMVGVVVIGCAMSAVCGETDRIVLRQGISNGIVATYTGNEDARLHSGPNEAFNYGGSPLLAVGCDAAGSELVSLLRYRVNILAGRVQQIDRVRLELTVAKDEDFRGSEIVISVLDHPAASLWLEGSADGVAQSYGASFIEPRYSGAKQSGWPGGHPQGREVARVTYAGGTTLAFDLPANVVTEWLEQVNGGLLLSTAPVPGKTLWFHSTECQSEEARPTLTLVGRFSGIPDQPVPLVEIPPFDPKQYNALTTEAWAHWPKDGWRGRWIQNPEPAALRLELDYATNTGDAWDFDEGDLEAIAEMGTGIQDSAVRDGRLHFRTELPKAYFSFGNMYENPNQRPALLWMNRDWFGSTHWAVEVRMRQSAPVSQWVVSTRPSDSPPNWTSPEVQVRGTDWQTVIMSIKRVGQERIGALALETFTTGNHVEIDYVRVGPCSAYERFLKSFTLTGTPARFWCTVMAAKEFKLYVNGTQAAWDSSLLAVGFMPRIEIDPQLLKRGHNVIAIETDATGSMRPDRRGMYFQATIRTREGDVSELVSDSSWKSTNLPVPPNWTWLGYSPHMWKDARDRGGMVELGYTEWTAETMSWNNPVIPPYFGSIELDFDGERPPFVTFKEEIPLGVFLPGETPLADTVRWKSWHVETRAAAGNGTIHRWKSADYRRAGTLTLRPQRPGVHILELELVRGEQTVDRRVAEVVVIGRLDMPVARTTSEWEKALDLQLVDEVDCTQSASDRAFLDGPELGSSRVIEDEHGAYRITAPPIGKQQSVPWFSYTVRLRNRLRPHVIVVDMPQHLSASTQVWFTTRSSRTINDTQALLAGNGPWRRFPFPLEQGMARYFMLVWPNHEDNAVTLSDNTLNLGLPASERGGAAASRIRIYEIAGQLPAAVPDAGTDRLIGPMTEQWPIINANFMGGPGTRFNFGYREWYRVMENAARSFRFRGENLFWAGMYMYDHSLFPSFRHDAEQVGTFTRTWHGSRYGADLPDLMMRVFGANDIQMILGVQYTRSAGLRDALYYSADEIRDGADTADQVSRDVEINRGWPGRAVNPFHPAVRREMDELIGELAARYAGHPNVLGIGLPAMGQGIMPSVNTGGQGGTEVGKYSYDDRTVALFEQATSLTIPPAPDARARFAHRAKWIRENAWDRWIAWRAQEIAKTVQWLADCASAHSGGRWNTYYAPCSNAPLALRQFGDAEIREAMSVKDAWLASGVDLTAFRDSTNVVFAPSETMGDRRSGKPLLTAAAFRDILTDREFHASLAKMPRRGAWIGEAFTEYRLFLPPGCRWITNWQERPKTQDHLTMTGKAAFDMYGVTYASPLGRAYLDEFCQVLALQDPELMLLNYGDVIFPAGQEDLHAEMTRAFRAMPRADYRYVAGGGTEDNVVVKQGVADGRTILVVVNPVWWPVTLDLKSEPRTTWQDRVSGEKISGSLRLKPYETRVLMAQDSGIGVSVQSTTVEPSAVAHVSGIYKTLVETPRAYPPIGAQKACDDVHQALRTGRIRAAWERMLKADIAQLADVTRILVDPRKKPEPVAKQPLRLTVTPHVNLLADPGFEAGQGSSAWALTRHPKDAETGEPVRQTGVLELTVDAAHSGHSGLRLKTNDTLEATARLSSSRFTGLKPGQPIAITAWARAEEGHPVLTLAPTADTPQGSWWYWRRGATDPKNVFHPTQEWTQFVLVIDAPVDLQADVPQALFVDVNGSGTLLLDDLEVYVVER
jgi:hypothetical protein